MPIVNDADTPRLHCGSTIRAALHAASASACSKAVQRRRSEQEPGARRAQLEQHLLDSEHGA
ncbi:hypothetical protein ACU4GD_06360 [Cupriavidus basilensis]